MLYIEIRSNNHTSFRTFKFSNSNSFKDGCQRFDISEFSFVWSFTVCGRPMDGAYSARKGASCDVVGVIQP